MGKSQKKHTPPSAPSDKLELKRCQPLPKSAYNTDRVRDLDLSFSDEDQDGEPSTRDDEKLAKALHTLTNLTTLYIHEVVWQEIPKALQDALHALLRLPCLREVRMERCWLPSPAAFRSLFAQTAALDKLVLDEVDFQCTDKLAPKPQEYYYDSELSREHGLKHFTLGELDPPTAAYVVDWLLDEGSAVGIDSSSIYSLYLSPTTLVRFSVARLLRVCSASVKEIQSLALPVFHSDLSAYTLEMLITMTAHRNPYANVEQLAKSHVAAQLKDTFRIKLSVVIVGDDDLSELDWAGWEKVDRVLQSRELPKLQVVDVHVYPVHKDLKGGLDVDWAVKEIRKRLPLSDGRGILNVMPKRVLGDTVHE